MLCKMALFSFVLLPLANTANEEPRYLETLYASWGQSFLISEEVYSEKTAHQELLIFENPHFGRVLALDGVIQITEADEAIYHEMMVHVPLFSHDNPKSVLVIGGGDGGAVREILKHPRIERVVLVEIDPSVIELSKKYFPNISNGAFDDPRLQIAIEDGCQFVKHSSELFDVIICDSTDPVRPGAALFTAEFYGDCKKRLGKNGIFVNQNGVPFMQPEELALTAKNRKPHFKHIAFYTASIPSYAGGSMAFGWASDKKYRVAESILQKRLETIKGELFYYNPSLHKAAFALPNYMLKQLESND